MGKKKGSRNKSNNDESKPTDSSKPSTSSQHRPSSSETSFQGPPLPRGPSQTQTVYGQQVQPPSEGLYRTQPPYSVPPPAQPAWGQQGQHPLAGPVNVQYPYSVPPPTQTAWGQRGQPPSTGPVNVQHSYSVPPPAQTAWGQRSQQSSAGPGRAKPPYSEPPPAQPAWGQQGQPPSTGPVNVQHPYSVPPPAQTAWGQRSQQSSAGPVRAKPPYSEPPPAQPAWGQQGQPSSPGSGNIQVSYSGPPPGQPAWGQRSQQPPASSAQLSYSGPPPAQSAWDQSKQLFSDDSFKAQPSYGGPPSAQPSRGEGKISPKEASKPAEIYQQQKPKFAYKEQALAKLAPRIIEPNKKGRKILVATNYFPLFLKNPNITAIHYDVEMEPNKPKYLLRSVWNQFIADNFKNRITAYDGVKNAYSRNDLEDISAKVVVYNNESGKDKEFIVTIKKVREISFSCFRQKLNVLPEAEISVLETILKNGAFNRLIGTKNVFFPKTEHRPQLVSLSNKLDLRRGHYQSVVLGSRLFLNFDVANKPFYKEMGLLDVVESFRMRDRSINTQELNSFLRSVKIKYEIPNNPASRKIFRTNGVVKNAREQSFEKENGEQINVEQYFFREKGIRLAEPKLPLLWVGPTQRTIYVPMEFCKIAEDQVFNGPMDPTEHRKMVTESATNARDRRSLTEWTFKNSSFNDNPFLKEFGISVGGEMEKVPARVLDPPQLRTTRTLYVNDGVWRAKDFYEPMNLKKWCILNLDRYAKRENLMDLQELIKNKGRDCQMRIGDPERAPIDVEPTFADIKRAFSGLKNMDIVFVVISEAKGLYSKIKTICETQEGVLTQCIKGKTIAQDRRKIGTTIENLLLKVNAKLGGKNHCFEKRSLPSCLEGYTMIIGADVTHPSPGTKMPSIAAVAVSCDPNAFQYGITLRVQTGEVILNLDDIIKLHLKKFQKIRGAYPEKIIFFRDGVSEGELIKVFSYELEAVKKACTQMKCNPKITLVIVQKRHHTRLYPTCAGDECGTNFNVPVGTCVDTEIISQRDLDFYLVSHMSIKGTARPTRYRLLHDDNKLTDEKVEELAFYLCHMFSRCKRSVSYPSPTYNAHLAAFRARAYLEGLNISPSHSLPDIQAMMQDRISNISPMFFV